MTNDCKTCPVSTGTHKPAEAVHQIDEPQADALRLAAWLLHRGMSGIKQNDIEASNQLRWLHAESLQHKQELAAYRFTVENREARIAELEDALQFVERWAVHHGSKPSISAEEALSCIQHYPAIHEITKSYKDGKRPDTFNPYARIAELESQLEAIGAGGVEPLRKPAAQAVQTAVPVAWRLTNTAFRKPRFEYHDTKESAEQRQADFNRSVDDGGLHNLTPLYAAPAHPAEGVPAQAGPVGYVALAALTSRTHADDYAKCFATEAALLENYPAAKAIAVFDHAATQPAAQGMDAKDAARYRFLRDGDWRENDDVAPFIHLQLNALWDEKIDAALAAQANQGGAA